jgi:ribonuclease HII
MPKRKLSTTEKRTRCLETHPEGLKLAGKFCPWPILQDDIFKIKNTIWVDEAGMGCYAGPLHVGFTYLRENFDLKTVDGIHDTKLLKPHERKNLYDIILKSPDIVHHIEICTNDELDDLGGLGQAWQKTIRKGVSFLKQKILSEYPDTNLEYVCLDGNKTVEGVCIPVRPVVKGDRKYIGVSAAAILAKVSRDAYMVDIADEYAEFSEFFKKGKGYRHSKAHDDLILQGVFTELHRKTYNPLKTVLKNSKQQ